MVLNEYLHRFFYMLQAGIRIDSKEKMEWITIIGSPGLKPVDRRKLTNQYKKVFDNEDSNDPERIKKDRELLLKKLKGKVL
jgi:hypothetical protein